MRNAPRQAAILAEVDAVYIEYQQRGFVINSFAVQEDPIVLPAVSNAVNLLNWSPERHNSVVMHNRMLELFMNCDGIYNTDSSVNHYARSTFMRCWHNTAHISAVNMAALQLCASRANPTQLSFGQHNHRGQIAPRTNELNNACNFLTNYELIIRTGVVDVAMGRTMVYMEQHGKLHWTDALRMVLMHSAGQYIQFIRGIIVIIR